MTNFEMVKKFQELMGHKRNTWPPDPNTLELRMALIDEEIVELFQESGDYIDGMYEVIEGKYLDKTNIAKELADLLYVVYGAADSFGIDIDRVFEEVHKSNMSKLGKDGKPIKREDGKVLKGPDYKPPQLEFIFK